MKMIGIGIVEKVVIRVKIRATRGYEAGGLEKMRRAAKGVGAD